MDVGGGDPGVEGQRGQDRGLGGGVEALDVGGRVGLGVPELLGLLERLGEAGAGGVHLVEDEVGGAVDDAEHPGDLVAGERLAQRAQDRDRAGDGGLVVEVAAGLLGGLEEGRAVLGEQRLVGGDHRGAVLERGQDQRAGRLDAADHLDDQVDVVAGDQARSRRWSAARRAPRPRAARRGGVRRRRPARPARRPGPRGRRPAHRAAAPPASPPSRSRARPPSARCPVARLSRHHY